MKIAILGAGAFGTALGGILAAKAYDIDYYDSKVEKEKLSSVLEGAKIILLAVPSKAVPYVLPYLPKNTPLIVATKGILSPKTFQDFTDFMVLSGPGFADDIKAHKPTHLTATDQRIIDLFSSDYLDFDFTHDAGGVLMCGALKNIYAILAGLLDLKSGTTVHEDFMKEVLGEMRDLLAANGMDRATVDLRCGTGDLRITCAPPSRNFEFGQILRTNKFAQPEKTVEGVSALKRVKRGEIVVPDSAEKLKFLMEISANWA